MKRNWQTFFKALKHSDSERGSLLVIAIAVLAVMITMTAVVVNSSYRELVRSELQAAADTAALSAAGAFCSQSSCFVSARLTALETIRRQVVHGGMDIDPKLEVPMWEVGNLINTTIYDGTDFSVQIQLGWFFNDQFVPFLDEVSWSAAFPGVPYQIALNALQITLTRKNVSMFLAGSLSAPYSLTVQATAVADVIDDVCSAPFAIPACSIEDRYTWGASGGFNPVSTSRVEKLFTRADRYCGGTDCDIHPSFPIEMRTCYNMLDSWMNDYWGGPVPNPLYCMPDAEGTILCGGCTLGSLTGTKMDAYPYWNSPRFRQTSDSFGFVGISGQAATMANVRSTLTIAGGCSTARIGSSFNILSSGFDGATTAAEDDVWSQILGNYGDVAWTAHTPLSTAPLPLPNDGFGSLMIEENWYRGIWTDWTHLPRYGKYNSGVCNSRRFDAARLAAPADLQAEVDSMRSNPVWVVNVPVIADSDPAAQPCSANPATNDPLPDPAHNWIVVGFVRMVIDDTDIGRAPPSYYDTTTQSLWFRGKGYTSLLPGVLSSFPETPATWSTTDFSFPVNCNLTRGRMKPDETLIPVTPNGLVPERDPALVR